MSAPLVVVDADVLGRRRTGDEAYVLNLLRELARLQLPFRLAAVARHVEQIPAGVEALELPARSQFVRMTFGLPRLLRRVGAQLGHFLHVLPTMPPPATVLTVQDLSFEHPGLMRRGDRVLFMALVPNSVRRATRVVVGSEFTRRDVVEAYGVPEERIVVTPYAADPLFRPDGKSADGPPYLLFVGALEARKDPLTAVSALAQLDQELRLVFVGPDHGLEKDVQKAAGRLGLGPRVELRGHVPKEELAALYRSAACLVFPSRYEGFGLPALEAMASGTPVVASTAGALPEVIGEAGVLVEPGEPDALAAGVEQALSERERLVTAGLARAARFSWEETARRTATVYKELL
jgi:glycosyltransferase involved in cell wall biosynthesis